MTNLRNDLRGLASVLADWAAGAPGFSLYLFGSRIRGDHRPDSDVDVSVEFAAIGDMEMQTANNEDLFAGIDARLPGKLPYPGRERPSYFKGYAQAP